MDATTLEALQGSIAKWERNSAAKTPDAYKTGADDCPLCCIFFGAKNCRGCPVYERTGKIACGGSPYHKAYEAWFEWTNIATSPTKRAFAHKAASAEAAFLKSLLPKEEAR